MLCTWLWLLPAQAAPSITIAFGHENFDFGHLFQQFSEKHNIDIVSNGIDNSSLKAQLLQLARKRQLPDILIVPADYLGLDEINLSPIPSSWLSPDLATGPLQMTLLNGQHYGIPFVAGNHLLLYYNKSLVNQPVRNWQQLLAQIANDTQKRPLIGWSFNEMYWFLPFLGAFDGLPIKDDNIQLNTKAMHKALKFYWSLDKSGVVDAKCNYQCADNAFSSGELPYTINGLWAYQRLQKALGKNLGVALLPAIERKPMRPYFSTHLMVFPNLQDHPQKAEAIKQVALYLQSKSVQSTLWYNFKALPVTTSAMATAEDSDDNDLQVILRQLKQSAPMPNNRKMLITWEAMSKGFSRYGAGILTSQEAAELMQYLAERTLETQARE